MIVSSSLVKNIIFSSDLLIKFLSIDGYGWAVPREGGGRTMIFPCVCSAQTENETATVRYWVGDEQHPARNLCFEINWSLKVGRVFVTQLN
jgi:hypothetical protein